MTVTVSTNAIVLAKAGGKELHARGFFGTRHESGLMCFGLRCEVLDQSGLWKPHDGAFGLPFEGPCSTHLVFMLPLRASATGHAPAYIAEHSLMDKMVMYLHAKLGDALQVGEAEIVAVLNEVQPSATENLGKAESAIGVPLEVMDSRTLVNLRNTAYKAGIGKETHPSKNPGTSKLKASQPPYDDDEEGVGGLYVIVDEDGDGEEFEDADEFLGTVLTRVNKGENLTVKKS